MAVPIFMVSVMAAAAGEDGEGVGARGAGGEPDCWEFLQSSRPLDAVHDGSGVSGDVDDTDYLFGHGSLLSRWGAGTYYQGMGGGW